MTMIKRIAAALFLLLALSGFAHAQTCAISGTLYKQDGVTPDPNQEIRVKIEQINGIGVNGDWRPYTSNASGVVSFNIARGAQIRVVSDYAVPFNRAGGKLLTVPQAASADLWSLVAAANIPTQGLTIKNAGTPLASLIGTINFTNGVTASQTSTGVAQVGLSPLVTAGSCSTCSITFDAYGRATAYSTGAGGGGGLGTSLLIREVDGNPTLLTPDTLEFQQASGLVVTNPVGNTARIDLSGVPLSKLAALTASRALASDSSGVVSAASVTSTELGYLSGVTSALQTQLNAKHGGAVTTNQIAMASGSFTLTDSPLSVSSGNTTASGTLRATGVGIGTAASANALRIAGSVSGYVGLATTANPSTYTVTLPASAPASSDYVWMANSDGSTRFDSFFDEQWIWSALQAYRLDALGTTVSPALLIQNTTDGTALAPQQYSPALKFEGRNIVSGGSRRQALAMLYQPNGAEATDGKLSFQFEYNGSGSYGEIASLSSAGVFTASGFAGSGASLTALNASNLASGTIPLARLSGITNTEISNSAAIAYSKLNLTGAIVNADLAGSISDSKLSTISTAGKVSDSALSSNVALLNAANVFTNTNTINPGTSSTTALLLDMAQPTSNLTTRDSHAIILRGTGKASGVQHNADWKTFVNVTDGSGISQLKIQQRTDSNSYTDMLTLDDQGNLTALNITATTNLTGAKLNVNGSDGANTLFSVQPAAGSTAAEVIDSRFVAKTLTVTSSYTSQRFTRFEQPTITAATSKTITTAATVAIAGAPAASGSATITNPYALWIESGDARFEGNLRVQGTLITGGTLNTGITGMVKSSGTSISAGVAATDYVAPGAITSSGLTMATSRLLGRSTASTGAIEEITVGSGFSLSGGALAISNPVPANLTLTNPASAATLTLAGGKTATISNTLTFSGTDGSTLNVGAGGTLGSAAFTASSAYEVPLTFSTGLTRSTNTVTVNTTQNIAKLSNLTSNGFVKTGSGDGTLSIDTTSYATAARSIATTSPLSGGGDLSADRTLSLLVNVDFAFTAAQSIKLTDSATNAISTLLTVGHNSSGTPAASFGAGLQFLLASSTTADQNAGQIASLWRTATHASRQSAITFSVINSSQAQAEMLRIQDISGSAFLTLGGTSSSFPAFKRNGTIIETRLADDSNYGAIRSQYFEAGTSLGFLMGTGEARFNTTGFRVSTAAQYLFTSSTDSNGTADAGLQRAAVNVVKVTNGSSGSGSLQLGSFTVSTLPTGAAGRTAYVTDGDAALAWGATVVNSGAGATTYLVWHNGSAWTVIGK